MSSFGNEREKNKRKVVALIMVTKDGAKILKGRSLIYFLDLWDKLIGLLALMGDWKGGPINWEKLKSLKVEEFKEGRKKRK